MTDNKPFAISRRTALKVVGTSGVVGLAGCSGGDNQQETESTQTEDQQTETASPTSSGTQFTTKLAASHYPIPACTLCLVVAKEKDFFSDYDVTLDSVTTFSGGGTTIRGVVTGGLGAGVGTSLPAVVQAFNSGAPLHLVGLTCASIDHVFQTPPNSSIQSIQDLKGGTIAVSNPGAVSEAGAIRCLQNADGISLDDVELLHAGGLGESITAVKEGAADVTWNLPPQSVIMEQDGKLRTVWHAREYAPNITEGTIAMGARIMDEQPELAKGIVGALIDGSEYMKNNVEESAQLWAEANDYPIDAATKALKQMQPNKMFSVELKEEVLKSTAETMMTQGLIDEQPPWQELVRQEVLPEEKQVNWI